MARCEDCIHYEVCKHHAKILEGDGYEVEFDDTPEVEKRCAAFKPTADVVPKSEVARLQEDVDRLQDINNRQVENIKLAQAEVAREIIDKIENWFELYSERECLFAEEETSKGHYPEAEAHDYALDVINDLRQLCIAELKKKYTEGENDS